MKNKVILKVIFVILSSYHYSLGQITQNAVAIPSPNASSLGEYGNTGVSFYNGTASVKIPITSVKLNAIDFPIYLNYNTSGVLPDIHPGWVGTNWNLNAGGSITRIVHEYPDELDNIKFPQCGFYYTYNLLNNDTWSSETSIKNRAKKNLEEVFGFAPDGGPGTKDSSPDEFLFNFLGYTGKFFWNHNGKIQVQCDKPIKVIFENNDFIDPFLAAHPTVNSNAQFFSKTFNKFTLIDEFGNKYVFGTSEAMEYSDELIGASRAWGTGDGSSPPEMTSIPSRGAFFFATSWHLKKVIANNGTELAVFSYIRGPFVTSLFSFAYHEILNYGPSSTGAGGTPRFGKFISPVYLTSILFARNNLKMNFKISKSTELKYDKLYLNPIFSHSDNQQYTTEQDERYADLLNVTDGLFFFNESIPPGNTFTNKLDRLIWGKLDGIEVLDNTTGEQKYSFEFKYNNIPNERLFLNQLKYRDKSLTSPKTYEFFYNSTPLPPYVTFYNDAAGYYNGEVMTLSQPASYNPDFSVLKRTDSNYVKAGILEKIKYPTGGTTIFEYELHDYNKAVSRDKTGVINTSKKQIGGLRIKRITDLSITGVPSSRDYYYVRNYSNGVNINELPSSGVINAEPYFDLGTLSGRFDDGTYYTYSYKASSPIIPLTASSNETYIGYSEVVENLSEKGYNIYYYTNHDNGYKDIPPVTQVDPYRIVYMPVTSLSFERGKIYKEKKHTKNNKLIQETTTEYTAVGDSNELYSRVVFSSFKELRNVVRSFVEAGCAYKMFAFSYLPYRIIEKQYDGDSYLMEIKEFSFHPIYKVPTLIKRYNSNGNEEQMAYKYSFDLANLNTSNPYTIMVQKNMIGDFIEQRAYVKRNNLNYLTSGILNEFKEFDTDKIYKNSIYKIEINNPIETNSIENTYYDSQLRFDSRYKRNYTFSKYNSLGNPIEIWENNQVTTYLWNQEDRLPIAKIQNASNNDVAYTSFEDIGTGNWDISNASNASNYSITGSKCFDLTGGKIISKQELDNSKEYILSYWAKPGAIINVSNATTINTGATRNDWTYYERPITGMNTINISGSGFIDELRLFPKESQMTTYSYDPVIGLTSQCSTNNDITYYEYDGFGQLRLIKDQNGKILKMYCYNYFGQLTECSDTVYQNAAKSKTFYKNNCPSGFTGGSAVTYTVPAGKYKAGTPEEADALAQADIDANGPTYANNNGTCLCSGVDKKLIGNQCETGGRVNDNSYMVSGGYRCDYHYEWSDGSVSGQYSEVNSNPCPIE